MMRVHYQIKSSLENWEWVKDILSYFFQDDLLFLYSFLSNYLFRTNANNNYLIKGELKIDIKWQLNNTFEFQPKKKKLVSAFKF